MSGGASRKNRPSAISGNARASLRLLRFCGLLALAAADYWRRSRNAGAEGKFSLQSAWLQRCAADILRVIGAKVEHSGRIPQAGLIVSNHLSYVDILVLASLRPLCFVSKAEVRRWPAIGALASCGGTIFIQREKKSDVVRVAEEIRERIEGGCPVVIFPEGTSSDGSSVLPFRSSLLAPAAERGWTVTPAWIGYTLADGEAGRELAYYGEMTFAPHLFNLFRKKQICARVVFGEPAAAHSDRKVLAAELHGEVARMAQKSRV